MLAIERRNAILSKLTLEGKVIVADLSRDFGVTEETSRRDLEKLDKDGKVLDKIVAGNPDVKRAMVSSYCIEKIFCSPDAKSFVILVEKRVEENGVPTIRYMVETFQF